MFRIPALAFALAIGLAAIWSTQQRQPESPSPLEHVVGSAPNANETLTSANEEPETDLATLNRSSLQGGPSATVNNAVDRPTQAARTLVVTPVRNPIFPSQGGVPSFRIPTIRIPIPQPEQPPAQVRYRMPDHVKVPTVRVPPRVQVPSVKVPTIAVQPVVKFPTIKVPSLKVPRTQIPTIKIEPVVKVPTIKVPSIKVPTLKDPPRLRVPSLKVPTLKDPPRIKVAEIKIPSIKIPSFKVPSIKIPSIKVPSLKDPPRLKIATIKVQPVVKVPVVKVPSIKVPTFKVPTYKVPSFKVATLKVEPLLKVPTIKVATIKVPSYKDPSVKYPSLKVPTYKQQPTLKVATLKVPVIKYPTIKFPTLKMPPWICPPPRCVLPPPSEVEPPALVLQEGEIVTVGGVSFGDQVGQIQLYLGPVLLLPQIIDWQNTQVTMVVPYIRLAEDAPGRLLVIHDQNRLLYDVPCIVQPGEPPQPILPPPAPEPDITFVEGETAVLAGEDLGETPGSARLTVGELAIDVEVVAWQEDAYAVTIPELSLQEPTLFTLTTTRADGQLVHELAAEIAPATEANAEEATEEGANP